MGTAGLDEYISQHFGRSPAFTIVDTETGAIEIINNNSTHMGGNGLPVDALRGKGVEVVIAGGLGPKAISAFQHLGIRVFVGAAGTVRDAIDDWLNGFLSEASMDNACREHRH
ncbi:NifB/NifX family molybdenum-iron cluster-binding protein [Methanothrix sp.]|uniref:NifB/NifX family molybdenum-iron cluster-binding protein n=1 Tax=Methanothrix sp. TaxID=90426 RepID=UPI003C77EC6D